MGGKDDAYGPETITVRWTGTPYRVDGYDDLIESFDDAIAMAVREMASENECDVVDIQTHMVGTESGVWQYAVVIGRPYPWE